MKFIFLDIDVLALRKGKANKRCVKNLNHIVAETGAHFIVTSPHQGWHEQSLELYHHGVTGICFDVTPVLKGGRRWHEIDSWIEHECRKGKPWAKWDWEQMSFVILDDDRDMGPFMERLVQTKKGLTAEDAEKAIQILNSPRLVGN